MGWLSRLLGGSSTECAVCGRKLEKLGGGQGYVMLSVEQAKGGIGVAEECRECGRFYCDRCYPSRPANSCTCGKGRDQTHREGGTLFRGSLRLVKVQYPG
jgi:hypothetical protein